MLPFSVPVITKLLIVKTTPCQRVAELASQALEHPLSLRQRIGLRLHYLICIWCERYAKQTQLLRTFMRRSGGSAEQEPTPEASLSPEARQRIKDALKR